MLHVLGCSALVSPLLWTFEIFLSKIKISSHTEGNQALRLQTMVSYATNEGFLMLHLELSRIVLRISDIWKFSNYSKVKEKKKAYAYDNCPIQDILTFGILKGILTCPSCPRWKVQLLLDSQVLDQLFPASHPPLFLLLYFTQSRI